MPDRVPLARPGTARAGADIDGRSLLVVVDAHSVVDSRGGPTVAQLPSTLLGVETDCDHRRSPVRRLPPVAVGVVAAECLRQPEGRPVAIDRAGLAIALGQDHGTASLGQAPVDPGDGPGESGPTDR